MKYLVVIAITLAALFGLKTRAAAATYLEFDLSAGVIPPYLNQKGRDGEVRKAAINYMLNMMSWHKDLFQIEEITERPRQIAKIDVAGKLLPDQLEFLRKSNPYACSPKAAVELRADWLASKFGDNSYYKLLGIDGDEWDVFAKKILVDPHTEGKSWKKLILERKTAQGEQESRISTGERAVLLTENASHEPVFLTIDRTIQAGEGELAPFRIHGISTAGELIFPLPNGLQAYALIAVNNEDRDHARLQYVAPSNFVRNNFATASVWHASHLPSAQNKSHTTINLGTDCTTCHRAGLIGPKRGIRLGKDDLKSELRRRAGYADSTREKLELRRDAENLNYLTEEEYKDKVRMRTRRFVDALYRANVFLPDPKNPSMPLPLIADFSAEYEKPPSLPQMASELETTSDEFTDFLQKHRDVIKHVWGENMDMPHSLNRHLFERNFCYLKEQVKRAGLTGHNRQESQSNPHPKNRTH